MQEKFDYMYYDKTFMVQFFGFKFKYENTMKELNGMDPELKKKVKSLIDGYLEQLDSLALKFEEDVKTLKGNMMKFGKLHAFFEREINSIRESEQENNILNALEKFDKVMMLTLRILELKVELQEYMKSIKDRLTNLTTYRVNLENVILNLSQVENELRTQEEKKKQLEAAQAE